ncbi:MAG TPA: DUF1684 domain-containing protein [Candidatus Dormibacteraeota bacterium]
MSEIEDFRRAKDHMFVHDADSPIGVEDREEFAGLAYFAPDPAFVIEGRVGPPSVTDDLRMPTSSGEEVVYQRFGTAHFSVDGSPAQLTLFSVEGESDLFVPFRDSTSGAETYGAGRYLEVPRPEHEHVELDFNYAYNPYCAYSEAYSCPLPPLENWLKVPIRAGERVYAGSDH